MTIPRLATITCTIATAICALIASWYWYLSSRPTPEPTDPPQTSISDNPEAFIMESQVNIYSIQAAVMEASWLNKKAAIWSAIAALLGAISSLLSLAQ